MSAIIEGPLIGFLLKFIYAVTLGWAVWATRKLLSVPTKADIENTEKSLREYVDLKIDPLKEDIGEIKDDIKDIKNYLLNRK